MLTRADSGWRSRSRSARALAAAATASVLWAVPAHAQPSPASPAVAPAEPPAPPPASNSAPAAAPAAAPGTVATPPDATAPPAPVPDAPAVRSRLVAEAIEVDPGATCLEHDKLVRRVARWLERDHVDARISVHVLGGNSDADEVAFAITFEKHPRAERKIHDAPEDCDQLHSALALSIALAIDATLMDAQRAQETEPDVPSDEELLAAGPPAPAYFRLAFGAFAHATSGLLTDLAPAASARIELGFVRWLDLRAGALVSRVGDQRLPGAEGRFDVDLIAGRLDACALYSVTQLRLLACAGGMAGSFRTRGEAFSGGSLTQPRLWLALVGGVELQAEITSWFALAVAIDLAVPLQRREINVRGPDGRPMAPSERQLTAVGVLVGAGPVFRFF